MDRPFVKVLAPGGYDFGEPAARLVRVSGGGLRGNDLREFVKRAGHQFADRLRNLDLGPGEVPVHLIALGATEAYGCNRNGDGFKEASCRKYHDTFVKHAKWFRDHRNKASDPHYGLVKLSMYNDRMKRIELLVSLNATKAAADRNGGLVADDEMERLAAGKDIPVSMSCRVSHDVCSCCGNKARSRAEYCSGIDEGGLCKAGGLKNNIGAVVADPDAEWPILHADNPEPTFFDISRVARPADRIAYTLGQLKAAGGVVIGGAEMAERLGVTAPPELGAGGAVAEMAKVAYRLAAAEAEAGRSRDDGRRLAFAGRPGVTWDDHGGRLDDALRALAMYKVAMPVDGFVAFVGRGSNPAVADAVRARLPGVYARLVKSGELVQLLESNPFVPADRLPPLAVRRWAEKRAEDYGLAAAAVGRRSLRAALYGDVPMLKEAAGPAVGPAAELAKHYALYQVAAAHGMLAADPADGDRVLGLLAVGNRVRG